MYIRYIHKLCELHLQVHNYTGMERGTYYYYYYELLKESAFFSFFFF